MVVRSFSSQIPSSTHHQTWALSLGGTVGFSMKAASGRELTAECPAHCVAFPSLDSGVDQRGTVNIWTRSLFTVETVLCPL